MGKIAFHPKIHPTGIATLNNRGACCERGEDGQQQPDGSVKTGELMIIRERQD